MTGERHASSRRLDKATRDFQEKMNVTGLRPEENLCALGQFFWGNRVRLALTPKVDKLTSLDPGTQPFVTFARSVSELIRVRKDIVLAQIDKLEEMAKRLPVNDSARKAMQALTAIPPGTTKDLLHSIAPDLKKLRHRIARDLENQLWMKLNGSRTNTPPEIQERHLSFYTAWLLSQWDATACWDHVQWAAQRLRIRRRRPKQATSRFNRRLIVGSAPWGFSDRTVRDDRVLGDVVYQRSVSTVVERMKVALNEGQMLHARVLSGWAFDFGRDPPIELTLDDRGQIKTPQLQPEHSLLVFDHNGTDTFVFHDADASVSHTPQNGFGLLFYDPTRGRLDTAASPSDRRVSRDGYHSRGDKRYQVLMIFSA